MGFVVLYTWFVLWVGGLLAAVTTARRWTAPTGAKVRAVLVAALGALLGAPFMLTIASMLVFGKGPLTPPDGIVAMAPGFLSLPYGPLGFLQSLRMAPWLSFGLSFEVVRITMGLCWVLGSFSIVGSAFYI